jgi:hypothetical protein
LPLAMGLCVKKFNATRTIIQVATIEAESVEEARHMAQADSEAIAWRDTANRFMVFENVEPRGWEEGHDD